MWQILDFFKRFFYDLSHALFFAILDYNDRLKATKTLGEIILIWTFIIIISLAFIYFILFGFWSFLDNIDTSGITIE